MPSPSLKSPLKAAPAKKNGAAPAAFVYLEARLAEKLCISRKDMRYLRKEALRKRVDWTADVADGRRIVYTEQGLGRLIEYLRATQNAQLPASFDDCRRGSRITRELAQLPSDPLTEMVVTRVFPNPRLLEAKKKGVGESVLVTVPSSKNFIPGMTLLARHTGGSHFRLEGRCPRFKGRY